MGRVAIARSLANDPEVILADEPTGNLDTKTGEKVMEFLQQLNREGKTIIMVTHEPELAKKYAEKVYWLKDGKVEKITVKDVNNDEEKSIEVDGVFIEIGHIASTDLVADFVERDEHDQIKVNCNCETRTEGLFAAGDVTNVDFKQITVAVGQATIAALGAYKYIQRKRN